MDWLGDTLKSGLCGRDAGGDASQRTWNGAQGTPGEQVPCTRSAFFCDPNFQRNPSQLIFSSNRNAKDAKVSVTGLRAEKSSKPFQSVQTVWVDRPSASFLDFS